jgi:hypothetical protein
MTSGIKMDYYGVVRDCVSASNSLYGVLGGQNVMVSRSYAYYNGYIGIRSSQDHAAIVDSMAAGNAVAGFGSASTVGSNFYGGNIAIWNSTTNFTANVVGSGNRNPSGRLEANPGYGFQTEETWANFSSQVP